VLLSAKPLQKTPVSYMPTNEPITEDVLREVAKQLGPEAAQLAAALGISRPRIQVIERNASLRGSPTVVVNFDVLMMWVKALPKCADKVRAPPPHLLAICRPGGCTVASGVVGVVVVVVVVFGAAASVTALR